LTNGKFGAAVLIEVGPELRFLILDGFWDSQPTHEQASSRPFMSLPGARPDEVWKGWFNEALPASFVILGRVPFDPDQLRQYLTPSGTMVFGTAARLAQTLFNQWRLRFDREAFMAELERLEREYEEKERKRRENRSLKSMQRERPFAHWADQWPRTVVTTAHRIVRNAATELLALQGAPDAKPQRIAVLKRAVDQFNELYASTGCIETGEAAEIFDWVEQLASRVGLSNRDEQLTGHRTW